MAAARPRPRRDTEFFAIHGGAVLLSGTAGRMFALDPASALCWLGLEADDPHAEALAALQQDAGLTRPAAEAWYAAALQQFADAGLLDGTEAPEPVAPVTLPPPRTDFRPTPIDDGVTLHGRLGGLRFALTVPPAVAPLAAGLLAPTLVTPAVVTPGSATPDSPHDAAAARESRAVPTAPEARQLSLHRVDGAWLLAGPDGVVAQTDPGLDAAAALELLLVELAARHTPHLAMLHAALLGRAANGLLIAGESGAGKTTLSATLAAAGWRYGGDERVLLSPDASTALPLPMAPCVKPGAILALRRLHPALDTQPDHPRYARFVRYLPLPEAEQSPMVVRAVVFPERASGATPALRELAPLEGLRRLMQQCLRVPRGFGAAEVQHLLAWHDGVTYLGLRYSEAATVVPLLERLVAAP